jgi:DNA modification methylase
MPPQVVENLLWFYTEPGQIVFDPFAGGGTTIKTAKEMGRRVWSSDIAPSTPMLPIHEHNILDGWPANAPKQADFILLDPPYWKQAHEQVKMPPIISTPAGE